MSTLEQELPPMISGLLRPEAYPHSCSDIELVETHVSWVLLTGSYAYKIKKPLNLGFLDFGTLEKRRACCQEELRLNGRTAPDIYLSVVPLTGTPENPRVGQSGDGFEYAVKMKQFDQSGMLDRQLQEGRLTKETIDKLADKMAAFHGMIAVAEESDPYGSPTNVQTWALENFQQLETLIKDPQRRERIAVLKSWTQSEFARLSERMLERKRNGFVRECHGDLHLRNVTEIDGSVVAFDGIEFNAEIRWIDVINELAFLFTDLEHRKRSDLAWRALNRYLEQTGDYEGLCLFRYYSLYRIMVRAKVDSLRLEQPGLDDNEHQELEADIDIYLDQADPTVQASQPVLLLMRGLSGSGKTYLSQQLLEAAGMIRIRSDVERKRLHDLRPEQKTDSPVGGGLYSEQVSTHTFQEILKTSRNVLSSGLSTIVDATFLRRPLIEDFQAMAQDLGVSFTVFDVRAPESVLRERIEQRAATQESASEATQAVLDSQLQDYSELEAPFSVAIDGVSPPTGKELAHLLFQPRTEPGHTSIGVWVR